MCAIIGVFNNDAPILEGLEIMRNRGKDSTNTLKLENGIVGHNLHAIVNHVPQPLKNKGVLVTNCEVYNWKELNKKYGLKTRNDAETMLNLFDELGVEETVQLLDGVYAFAYYKNNTVWVGSDKIGVKPLWYSLSKGLGIASEKRALEELGFKNVRELIPRHTLKYNITTGEAKFEYEEFKFEKEVNQSVERIVQKLEKIIIRSVKKRVPSVKYGILFSGGVDSLIIAKTLQNLGEEFTCYTVGIKSCKDLKRAKRLSKKYGFRLVTKKIAREDVLKALQEIIPLIQDTNVVKVSVGVVTHLATKLAARDGAKVMLSGVGADELFAGYSRHSKSKDVNLDCYSDLLKIFEKNTYRDDAIGMNNAVEIRFPFLDKELVSYAMRIPGEHKVSHGTNKYCLRLAGKKLGLASNEVFEKKIAAQYGSGIDKEISKLAKKKKAQFLKQFYGKPNLKLGALVSGGKDSVYACLLYTSPSPRDLSTSRMPSSA